ncbi:MAG TPA: cytochrome c family protein [Steroidobacteraceae bacterium]|jgi:cytochrome c
MLLNSMRRCGRLLLTGILASVLLGLSACGGGSSGGASTASLNGDPVHGKELYATCMGCHKLQENSIGPMHCGLFGRTAGTVPGFDYSEAMKASGIVWDAKKLDEFLTSPIAYVVGTKMGFAGFEEAKDRADVITYLQQANKDPAVCPKS